MNSIKYVVCSLIFFVGFQEHKLHGMFGMNREFLRESRDEKMEDAMIRCLTQNTKKTPDEQMKRAEARQLGTSAVCEQLYRDKSSCVTNNQALIDMRKRKQNNNKWWVSFKQEVKALEKQMDGLIEGYFIKNTKTFDIQEKRKEARKQLMLTLGDEVRRQGTYYNW